MPPLMRDLVDVERITRTADGKGGYDEVAASIGSERMAIQPAGAGERESAQRLEATVSHVAYMGRKSGVKRNDVLTLAGTSYQVLQVASLRWFKRAMCREVQLG